MLCIFLFFYSYVFQSVLVCGCVVVFETAISSQQLD